MIDVIVVGGGPAGASLALALGRSGLEVELYEQARFPREKPCGEGLLPGGVEVLRKLGLEEVVAGKPLSGVRYHVGPNSLQAGFRAAASGAPRFALGQRRLRLDHVLWSAASRTRGISAHQGVCVQAPLLEAGRVSGVIVDGQPRRSRCVVAADGASSTLRRRLGLEQNSNPRRVGVRAHYRLAPGQSLPDVIQIFLRHGYELYVTPLPNDEVLVAALAHQDAVSGSLRSAFRNWLHAEDILCEWLDGASQISELSGRAPLIRETARRPAYPGLFMIGDAATSVDPITAGGMSLALITAQALARELPLILCGCRAALSRFEQARSQAVRVHRLLGGGLLALGQHPRSAQWALSLMQSRPSWMQTLVELASRGSL